MWFKILAGTVVCLTLLLFEAYVFTSLPSGTKYKVYRFQFAIVLNLVFYAGSKHLWQRVVKDVLEDSTPNIVKCTWKSIVMFFLVLAHISPFTTNFVTREPTWLNMAAWTCFGAYILLFAMLVPLDYFFKFLRKTSRIKFFSPRKVSLFVVVTVTLCSVMAFQTAVQAPRIISVEVPIAKLAPSMDKMRIGLISDIHLGPTVGYTQLKRVVDMTNALNPDIVVFSGDLMDATLADVDGAATPLAELKAPYGKYFATGNHEYYTGDIENWFKALESYGFVVLHNSNRKIQSKSNPNDWICILGTDDIQADQIRYEGHGMDLKKAYKGCDLSHPAILIAHQPKAAQIALDSDFSIQLILSGHTHGGQMYPIIWLCYLVNPFMSGLYHPKENSYVYVSQGSVYYGFPLRWGTYPEITNITLRAT